MNFLKSKFSSERRFGRYDPRSDYSKPEVIGLINNETDYDYGTPALSRKENVTLVGSNSNKDFVYIKFQWRPQDQLGQDGLKLVCLATKFQLKVGQDFYEHNEIRTYAPAESALRPGRITQYGGQRSGLKMFIAAPYRRVRLVFSGQMTNVKSGAQCFVKARFVVSPTSTVFDFLSDFSGPMNSGRSINLKQDRHEQMVQLLGECTIQESGTDSKVKLCVYGFHMRHFPDDNTQSAETKRIFATSINGQTFHVGHVSFAGKVTEFGWACLDLHQGPNQVDKLPVIDWSEIDTNTEKFEFEMVASDMKIVCTATKIPEHPAHYFEIKFNAKKGWALLELNDTLDSTEVLAAMENSVSQYQKDLKEGKIWHASSEMPSEKPLIVKIEDSACTCSELVGAKASSLAQLHRVTSTFGYEVPHAIVLTRHAHDMIMDQHKNIRESVRQLEAAIGSGSSLAELQKECQALQKLIEDTDLPEQLRAELECNLSSSEHSGAYAVRSSSWGEDEEDMSAAGQLSTILGAKGLDAIGKAVMKCLASKFSLENVEYKRQHGLRPSLPMAVVVQEMVQCEKAGVMFTCDPTNGDNTILTITANYGLGESVVSGQADPDTVQVRVGADKKLSIAKVDIGQKKIIVDGEGSGQYDRSKCCLSDDEILRLAECGLSLAHYFQGPRDIEWGYKGGNLFMFQSRPVTGLDKPTEFEMQHEADQPCAAEADFCTRANVGEVMPFAQTPLTISFATRLWSTVRGVFMHRNTAKVSEAAREIILVSYHSLFELRNSMFFDLRGASAEKSVMARAMEIGLFGREIGAKPDVAEASTGYPPRRSPFEGFWYDMSTLNLRLMPMTMLMRAKRDMKTAREKVRLRAKNLADENRLQDLFSEMIGLSRYYQRVLGNHINIIIFTNHNNIALMGTLSKYIKDPVQLFAGMTRFFATSLEVISAEIPKRMEQMASAIKSKGEADAFKDLSTEEALEYIKKDEKLNKEYQVFLELFGHRAYNEFELAERSWKENQAAVIEMLQKNCKTPDAVESTAGNQKHKTLDEVIDSLGIENMDQKDRFLLKHKLGPKCQMLVAARERTKDTLVEFTDIMREMSRVLARELRKSLRLPDEDLIYYLFLDELHLLVRSPCPSLVVQATRRRNMYRKLFKEPWLFDEVIPGPDYTPNHLKPSKELDEALMSAPQLHGTPASGGRVQAKVCLVKGFAELNKVRAGDILVTHSTDIAFSPVFPLIAGIVTEVGGLISHGAVVAREYGLPSLLGIPDVTRILQDGEEIVLDADKGTIHRLNAKSTQSANGCPA